jgi:NNP family nitrate/nitrite transporter-like MFS transporter
MSTLSFTVCFAIWMMFAVIGMPIKKMLDLDETQFVNSSIFMLMWGVTLVSLVWMYWTEIVPQRGRAAAQGA